MFLDFFYNSSAHGITILVLISSCLLHLVVTAYFFFLEIFGDRVSKWFNIWSGSNGQGSGVILASKK